MLNKKIRVALSNMFYPCSMGQYFVNALKARDDVELWTVGPYTGNFIPWNFGMYLPERYAKQPDHPLPQNLCNRPIPFALVQNHLPWIPDLFLMIDAGWHFTDRPDGTVVALVETDPHVIKAGYEMPKRYSDITFCMQMPYMQDDEVYLPYAVDDTTFYPEDREKIHDACLIGLHYPQRDQLVHRLRDKGLDVYYDLGIVYDECRQKYNESKVALSWSTLNDTPVRVFEAMGMSLPLVTNRTPDLANFFVEGEHYLGFDRVEEAEKQVLKLLLDEEMAAEISYNAYRKVIAGHTFKHRVQQILEACKLL
jgi:hypothetical protein